MHGVIGVITLAITTIYIFYFTKACVKKNYYDANDYEHYDEYEYEVGKPLLRFTAISFLVLCIIFFTAGCVMLNRLRLYFVDFYKESGCKLWTANILLTLPLTFRSVFDGLNFNTSWYDFWGDSTSMIAGYNLLLIFIGTYVPMIF